MYKFDFLSSAPRNFIFQKYSNKTNFGGLLSVLYLILFLIISLYYLISYYNEDNYSIQYIFQEKLLTGEENDRRLQSKKYNPNFLTKFYLDINAENEVKKRFYIIDNFLKYKKNKINQSEYKIRNISEVNLLIVYDCLDENETECNNIKLNDDSNNQIYFNMIYNGFKIDHQNKTAPLYRKSNSASSMLYLSIETKHPQVVRYTWNNIKYREEKGLSSLFNNKDENDYIGLTIKSTDNSYITSTKGDGNIIINGFDLYEFDFYSYKLLGQIQFSIDFNQYDEYKRKSKSFWDTIANICSLNMVLLNGFSLIITNFYSNDFNNYKIMEKILSNSKNSIEKNEHIKINNNESIKDNLIDNSNQENNIIVSNEGAINDDNNELLEDNNIIEENYNLPELNLCDFIFKNIHDNKCCCKINRQNIIHKCNEIISKYYSIEYILYYQIKIENLLKDYRWNDPRLNIFESNELISQLKNNISSFNG